MHKAIQDDIATYVMKWRGTHAGPFGAVAPTNKKLENDVVFVLHVKDDKIVKLMQFTDRYGLLVKLGALPPDSPIMKDSEDVETLRKSLCGRVVTPLSFDYKKVASLANGDIKSEPAIMILCQGVSDVVKAIAFCKDFEKKNPSAPRTVVRGGGHSFAGVSTNIGGCVIDLRNMRSVVVDPAERTAWVEGGATVRELDCEAFMHGLVLPTGQINSTGIGGLATGGGYGLLTHKFGLMIDNILALEMVLADGRVCQCSAKENGDMFWAAKGGARWLGVVTRFKFQLHKLETPTCDGLLAWDVSHAEKAFKAYTNLVNMDAFGFAVVATPPPLGGVTVFLLHLVVFGDISKAKSVQQWLEKEIGAKPMKELTPVAQRSWPEVNSAVESIAPYGRPLYVRGLEVEADGDKPWQLVSEFIKRRPKSVALGIDYYGKGYVERGEGEDSFFGHNGARHDKYNCAMMCALDPSNPNSREEARSFAKSFLDATASFVSMSQYVNFEEHRSVEERTSTGVQQRFAKIKWHYDPEGFFGKSF